MEYGALTKADVHFLICYLDTFVNWNYFQHKSICVSTETFLFFTCAHVGQSVNHLKKTCTSSDLLQLGAPVTKQRSQFGQDSRAVSLSLICHLFKKYTSHPSLPPELHPNFAYLPPSTCCTWLLFLSRNKSLLLLLLLFLSLHLFVTRSFEGQTSTFVAFDVTGLWVWEKVSALFNFLLSWAIY